MQMTNNVWSLREGSVRHGRAGMEGNSRGKEWHGLFYFDPGFYFLLISVQGANPASTMLTGLSGQMSCREREKEIKIKHSFIPEK